MEKAKKKTSVIFSLSIFSAFAASICCITPVLALVSGSSGLISTFSFMDAYRPYMIGFTALVLGFAWFQKLKPKKTDPSCACEDEEKQSFWQSRGFLGIVTLLAIILIAFPYYAESFYPKKEAKEVVIMESNNIKTAAFSISGMTCAGCEAHVEHEVNKLPGIISVEPSYDNGRAIVIYDGSKTSTEDIEGVINNTGYSVVSIK